MKNRTLHCNGRGLLLAAVLLVFAFRVVAGPVDAQRARFVAKNFLNINDARSTGLRDISAEAGFANVYVFSTDNSFVLVPADDRLQPVLGYSLNGKFDYENMPENKAAWIQEYSDAVAYAIEHQTRATDEVLQQWNDLAAGRTGTMRAVTVVAPLLTTQWNQGSPYNMLCPSGSVTGCVATAMAQVMKYWNYPSHGIGTHTYTHSTYGDLTADFQSTNYDWTNMLDSYSGSSTQVQKLAVATLMYHCGVSVDMIYSPSSSGAPTPWVADALKTYFHYSSETQHQYREDYDDAVWISMLKSDLDQLRPIQYHGSGSGGHSFVFDGYNSSNYFHVNWGWGGYCDEYYPITNLSPGPGGIGSGSGNYNNGQGAILGAHPSDCAAADPTNLTYTQSGRNVTLTWNACSGAVSYNVYWNGHYVGNTASPTFDHVASYGSNRYWVRSVDATGEMSLSSNDVTVTVDYETPVVDDLTATVSNNNVTLSWTAPDWCYPETPTATLSYGEGSLYYSWSYTCYGHRYLAADLAQYANKAVYKVGTFVSYPGDYTVYIYTDTNGSQPMASSLAATKSIHCTDSYFWLDFELDEPIILSGTKDLWVVMKQQNTGQSFPVPSFNQTGSYNANACYAGSNPTSLSSVSSYSVAWLIRTCLTDGVYTYNIYKDGSSLATNVGGTSYNDNNLAPGTYNYYVKTIYYAGESTASNQVTAQIGAGDYIAIGATANPTIGGTVTGAGSYLEGGNCTLTANANPGYSFVNWTKNGTVVSNNNPYSFTVTEAGNYVANFVVAHNLVATPDPIAMGYRPNGAWMRPLTVNIFNNNDCNVSINSITASNPYFQIDLPGTAYPFILEENADFDIDLSTGSGSGEINGTLTINCFNNIEASFNLSAIAYTPVSPDVWELAQNVTTFPFTATLNATTAPLYDNYRLPGDNPDGPDAVYKLTIAQDTYLNASVTGENGKVALYHENFYGYGGPDINNYYTGEPISEWLHYDDGTYSTSVGMNSATTLYWASMFPTEMLAAYAGTNLTKVSLYENNYNTNDVTVSIYLGGDNAPGTLMSTMTYTPVGNGFHEVSLTTPVAIDGTQNLWIVFNEYGTYVANACADSGEVNNRWLSFDGTSWMDLANAGVSNHGWMIRGFVTNQSGRMMTLNGNRDNGSIQNVFTPAGVYYLVASSTSNEFTVNVNTGSLPTQTTTLANGWSWWSTYIEQEGIDGLSMLENSLGNACTRIQSRMEFIDNLEYMGYHFWDGTLTAINNEESYRIRTNTACQAAVTGAVTTPAAHPITVNPGWNWIGFPSSQALGVTAALSSFSPTVNDQIKGRYNFATYLGNYGGTDYWDGYLTTLEPGQGYMYKSNATTAKTLVYQTGSKTVLLPNGTTKDNFYTPVCEEYADNMTITAEVVIEGTALRSEYELAAFAGNECRGSVKLKYVEPLDRYLAFLMVFGDGEEALSFVLTDGEETLWSNESLMFTANGALGTPAEPLVLYFGTTGVDESEQARINIYPNPSNGVFNVEGNGIQRVEVLNAMGQTLFIQETQDNRIQIDLSGKAKGMYLLRVVTENGILSNQLLKY